MAAFDPAAFAYYAYLSYLSYLAFRIVRRCARWLVAVALRLARRAPVASPVIDPDPEASFTRFREEVREAVALTARTHPRLRDLAASCPAALVAIAAPGEANDAQAASAKARALVIEGRPLAQVCAALDLPWWLRRARPETFKARPPKLPDTPALRRAIGPFVPTGATGFDCDADDPARWLDIVVCAFETADEEIGAWAARCAAQTPEQIWDHDMRLTLLWAWFARRSGAWAPRIGWSHARELAGAWRTRMEFDIFGGPAAWALAGGEFEGFMFTPLTTREDIAEEGAAMGHCVASYARMVAIRECALWSLRRDGERVATLEVGAECGADFITVRQLYGPGNAPAPREAWRAATLFSLQRADAALAEAAPRVSEDDVQRAWERLFEPYWAAKGGVSAWAPLRPRERELLA